MQLYEKKTWKNTPLHRLHAKYADICTKHAQTLQRS